VILGLRIFRQVGSTSLGRVFNASARLATVMPAGKACKAER